MSIYEWEWTNLNLYVRVRGHKPATVKITPYFLHATFSLVYRVIINGVNP